MTPQYLRRLVKSIAYRERLCAELPELKAELISYVQENDLKYLAGYEVDVSDGDVVLSKLPPQEYEQLELGLGEEYF